MLFGSVECYKCGKIVDAEGCQTRTVEVETGRSGGSWSMGGSKRLGSWISNGVLHTGKRKSSGVNLHYNTGRKYYKNVQVSICPACVNDEYQEAKRSSEFVGNLFGWLILGGMIYGLYLFVMFIVNLF